MTADFEVAYRKTYSFLMDRPLVVEAVAVEATGRTEQPEPSSVDDRYTAADDTETVLVHTSGAWRSVPLHERERLRPGRTVSGPAIIAEANATTTVDEGWRATVTDTGHLLLDRVVVRVEEGAGTEVDPVLLEIFNNLHPAAVACRAGFPLARSR